MAYRNRYTASGYADYRYSGYFPPGVKWLIIVNVAVYLVNFFVANFAAQTGLGEIFYWLGLIPQAVVKLLAVWQLGTYLFLHDPTGVFHILFNMLALWMFGADLERDWGTKRFLRYYFLCGVGAGLCVVAANLAFGNMASRTIGASGAIYGLLLAYGLLYPDRTVLFFFLFPIKARYYAMIIGAIAFLGTIGASGGGVSHVAHLGGMIFGYVSLRRARSIRFGFAAALRRHYHEWKLARAKRRFQVYMRKRNDRDRWVN